MCGVCLHSDVCTCPVLDILYMYIIVVSLFSCPQEERLFNFRALGRFIGLCLWFKQTVPLMISRHVAKFLLGRCVCCKVCLRV